MDSDMNSLKINSFIIDLKMKKITPHKLNPHQILKNKKHLMKYNESILRFSDDFYIIIMMLMIKSISFWGIFSKSTFIFVR